MNLAVDQQRRLRFGGWRFWRLMFLRSFFVRGRLDDAIETVDIGLAQIVSATDRVDEGDRRGEFVDGEDLRAVGIEDAHAAQFGAAEPAQRPIVDLDVAVHIFVDAVNDHPPDKAQPRDRRQKQHDQNQETTTAPTTLHPAPFHTGVRALARMSSGTSLGPLGEFI